MRLACVLVVLSLASGFSGAAERQAPSAPVASASAEGRELLLLRSLETGLVRVPVLDRCGDPAVGQARIRHIEHRGGEVIVTYGKHCSAGLSLKDMALECRGCD